MRQQSNTNFNGLTLHRFPASSNPTLRAWDAADELLLQHLAECELKNRKTCVIANDEFGALATSLHHLKPIYMNDSVLSHAASKQNLQRNHLSNDQLIWQDYLAPMPSRIDVLIVKIPRNLNVLEDLLIRLKPSLTENSLVLGAGMCKLIHTSTINLFSAIIGPTRTSLARKKARLIHTTVDVQQNSPISPWPSRYNFPEENIDMINHAAVFSANKPDIGSRFFLDSITLDKDTKTIVDLACGNGLLGIVAARRHPNAKLIFSDESWMAIASAEQNYTTHIGSHRPAQFLVQDCLQNTSDKIADCVLVNPPFHQQNVITYETAIRMFKDAKRVLKTHGKLYVVGNRHLAYEQKLKWIFGNAKLLNKNQKFSIFECLKR